MAEYLIDKAYLVALADAIRKKSGSSSKMTPSAMVSAINNLGDMTYTPQSSPTVINKTGELYTIQDTTFNSLAKAIRNKAGIIDKMTPHKMIDVVNGLKEMEETAFAVYSADDSSLSFYKRTEVPKVGGQFEGKTATEVYVGIEDGDVTPLVSVYAPDIAGAKWPCASYVTEVNVIDPIIAPRGLNGYFADFNTAHTMNLAKLDTSNVTNMKDMFSGCSSLTSLDLSCFNTSSVTDMMSMFRNCSELTTLNLYGFDTSSVKGAYLMFYRCYNLKQVTLGDKFTWVGSDGRLPTQNASNIPNADGKWYAASDGKGYAPSEIPSNKADTYYAYPPYKDLIRTGVPAMGVSSDVFVSPSKRTKYRATLDTTSSAQGRGMSVYIYDANSGSMINSVQLSITGARTQYFELNQGNYKINAFFDCHNGYPSMFILQEITGFNFAQSIKQGGVKQYG